MLRVFQKSPYSLKKILRKPTLRITILLLLLVSFFLPWISYGYIAKSGFVIPFYMEELKGMVRFFYGQEFHLPKELDYLYLIYLYPLILVMNLFWRSRLLILLASLLPLAAFAIFFYIGQFPIFNILGWGAYVTHGASLVLLVYFFLPKEYY